MQKAAARLPKERLWVNPDCGLKTRAWPETEAALIGMVQAARALRDAASNKPAAGNARPWRPAPAMHARVLFFGYARVKLA